MTWESTELSDVESGEQHACATAVPHAECKGNTCKCHTDSPTTKYSWGEGQSFVRKGTLKTARAHTTHEGLGVSPYVLVQSIRLTARVGTVRFFIKWTKGRSTMRLVQGGRDQGRKIGQTAASWNFSNVDQVVYTGSMKWALQM